jgi:Uma2 family endonuclease
MASPIRKRATHDDLRSVPDHLVAEIVAGDLHTSPRPSGRHSVASSGLGGQIWSPFDRGRGGPGGWWILDEPELHLGDDVLVPDLAGWRRERMPTIPETPHFTLAPDCVCEVLSPTTERFDRVGKLPVYAREGVQHVWLVNPMARTLEVLRLESGRWIAAVTHGGDDPVRAEPFAAIELDLAALWGERPPASR